MGKIKTGSQERRAENSGLSVEEPFSKTGSLIPIGRMGEAEEIANVITFLTSDAASSTGLDGDH